MRMRTLLVVLLLALLCRWGVAQVRPRYVIVLPGEAAAISPRGSVQLAGAGLVLIRFQGLRVLLVAADAEAYNRDAAHAWPAADLLLVLPPGAGRYHGLAPLHGLRDGAPVIVAAADAEAEDSVARAAGPALYPLQPWNALELRKRGARLRVTAMPGAPGTLAVAGYLLEVGNQRTSYRVYAGGGQQQEADEAAGLAELAGLAQRLPGADLALLPGSAGPRLLPLRRGAPQGGQAAVLTADGYAFTARQR